MPTVEELQRSRRGAFNEVMKRLITPVSHSDVNLGAYQDYDSTYQNKAKANAMLGALLTSSNNPASPLYKKQKAQAALDVKEANALAKAKKAAEAEVKKEAYDAITVADALNNLKTVEPPERKLSLKHDVAWTPEEAAITAAGPPKSVREIQRMQLAALTPEQLAELPVSVQKIIYDRQNTPDTSVRQTATTTEAPTENLVAPPRSLTAAIHAGDPSAILTADERAALGPNATQKEIVKAQRAKFTDQLVRTNAPEGLAPPKVDEGNFLERNVGSALSHVPKPLSQSLIHGLDYIDRPRNAIMTGASNIVNESMNKPNLITKVGAGTGIAAALGDPEAIAESKLGYGELAKNTGTAIRKGAEGVGQGITGKKHTGAGDIIEDILPREQYGESAALNYTKYLFGGAGDIIGDPTTYVTLPVKTVLAGGKKAIEKAGQEAFESALKSGATEVAAHQAKNAAIEVAKSAGKDAISNAVKKTVKDLLDKSGKLDNVTLKRKGGDVAARTAVHGEVQKAIDKMIYEIQGGVRSGQVIGSAKHIAPTVGHAVAESYRSAFLENLAQTVDPFIKGLKNQGKKFDVKALAKARQDPIFKQWHDEFVRYGTTHKGINWEKAAKKANEHITKLMEQEASDLSIKTAEQIRRATLRIPTMRVMGKEIAEFPRVGKFLSGVGEASRTGRVGETLDVARKLFSYGSNFPGYSTLIGQKVKAEGLWAFNKFRRRVLAEAKGVSKADREAIDHAIQNEIIQGLPQDLQAKAIKVKELYDEIRNDEIAAGMNYRKVDNYTYQYYHGGTKEKIKNFKQVRSNEALTGKIRGQTTEAAKKAGLRPETDAYKNLLYRKLKSNRRVTNHMFGQDLASHYGIQSAMGAKEAARRGLVAVPEADIPADLKKIMKPGHKLYLDKDIHGVWDNFKNISKVGTEDNARFVRGIDFLTRKFKTLNTIYYPGFHVRNMISDLYMGMMDGVGVKDYGTIINKMIKAARDPNIDMDIGGRTVKWAKLKDAYNKQAASGGYLNAELGRASFRGEAEGAKTLLHPTEYPSGIRRLSEHREDLGRLAHFKHAMDQELPAALKKTNNFDQAWDSAVNAAITRVNKYKFDYGALTHFEQNVMRRGIPFYTYMRKAIPTLSEAALTNPKLLNMTNKWMQAMGVEGDGELDLPDWVKQTGFAQLSGGSEPWGLTGQVLPQNVFNQVDSVRDIAAQTNPLLRGPFELAQGKALYNNKPVRNVGDLVINNVRAFNTYDKLMDGGTSGREKLANLMGIPLIQINEAKKSGQRRKMLHDFNARLGQWNELAKKNGYTVYLSQRDDGVSIRVNKIDGTDKPKDFLSLDEALQFLNLQ